MSASRNPDAMTSAQGEFRSRVPPAEPLTTKGHAPGVKTGNDNIPEFHAQTFPPGSAPSESTYNPQPTEDVSIAGLGHNASIPADNTMPGATSADVHQGYGHPGQGMTSQELHGGKRKKEGGEKPSGSTLEDSVGSRKLDIGHENRGKASTEYPVAENREPVSAETVASERK